MFGKSTYWREFGFKRFFLAKSRQKPCLYLREKLQRNPSVGGGLKIFIFRPYGFDYLGFLTIARSGARGQKLNGSSTGTKTDGLDHKKSNSGISLGTLRL